MNKLSLELEQIKNNILNLMTYLYKRDGGLQPVLFFIDNQNRPQFEEIPSELMSSPEGKDVLATMIKGICSDFSIVAGGIIMEAWAKALNINEKTDKEIISKIDSGELSVSEFDDKRSIILLIFSTLDYEEMVGYYVDPESKTIQEKIEDAKSFGGRFANMFEWKKNKLN